MTEHRPVIGVTTRRLTVDGRLLDVMETEYALAIALAGGVPSLIPRVSGQPSDLWLGHIDGLLLTGGGDIAPDRYGAEPTLKVGGVDCDRDTVEVELILGALDRGLPMLGICRGCQMINVASGGSLHQHLPDLTRQAHLVLGPRGQLVHEVTIEPRSQLAAAIGTERTRVNSIHHQAVDRCGDGLRPAAWSTDGIIEAIEGNHRPVIGVQWHPEHLLTSASHRALFAWLIHRSTERATMASAVDRLGESCLQRAADHD